MTELVVGLDIGTSSTKVVAVDPGGTVVAARSGPHGTSQPQRGWFEQDARTVWWEQSCELLRALLGDERVSASAVRAVGISGLGPCLLVCDRAGNPLRPAILYGIDMRATAEVAELTGRFGAAMGVRHNLEAFDSVRPDGSPWRPVAVGGGAAGSLWPQIVSDVCGRPQDMPAQTVGASYGDALLAAAAVGLVPPDTDWTKTAATVQPQPDLAGFYERRYAVYRDLYTATRPLVPRL